MKRILGYFRLMSPADPDSPLGGGGSEDLPVTKIPTAEEVVAHRRERIAQKEKDYEDSRKNRFSKQPQDDSGKGDEEDEDEDSCSVVHYFNKSKTMYTLSLHVNLKENSEMTEEEHKKFE